MLKLIFVLLSIYIVASLCDDDYGYNQKHINGFYCVKGNGLCVSGLQRCSSSCMDCTLFGTKCGFCRKSENCGKTCKDVGGILKNNAYMYYKKECTSFGGY
jgi:hypothetical protein